MSEFTQVPRTRVYRATSGIVSLILALVLAIVLLGDVVLRAGWYDLFLLAPWVLLGVWALYVALFASCVVTDAAGVTVRNGLLITRVPWQLVSDVYLRWQLCFELTDGSVIKAVGGPLEAPRRRRSAASPPTADADSEFIRATWELNRDAPVAGAAVRRGWDIPVIAALIVLVIWAIIAVVLA